MLSILTEGGGILPAMPPVVKPPRKRSRHFIGKWREYRGLSQDQLAERIGMSRANYSKIERGVVPYSQDFLEEAANALNCEPADLIMRDPYSPVWSIYDTLKTLPEEQQKQALAVIEALRKAS